MKNLIYIFITLAVLAGCMSNQKKKDQNSETKTKSENILATYTPEEILALGDSLKDVKVILKGRITHTCKHSGARCFVVGDDNPELSIRVEAKGNIGGFNRELSGCEIKIEGIVRENRLTEEYINQYEEAVREHSLKEDGTAETCDAEFKNIEAMRKWMKDNNKNYYSTYYMDGMEYEVIEE